ncbi:NAD(P)/FAD-dependent oxidoreductase [Lysobacter sp. A03]|uniref:flavin monoamine oxidase family protein n=1 Tax=Lysobacter sp. A03 TaxID=1199154 RepID=UPI0005B73D5A|nr:NAD(P)/FAD-dependent oxidoreductase [Lysobacter sp. A03]KIQ96169.1 Amine oxidase [flavin-containing] A [Lysobacter sp. A03]
MQRRRFLQMLAAASATPLLLQGCGWGGTGTGPSATEAGATEATDADILVLGAGIAGLHAAMLLEEQNPGRRVVVLEASQRVGGRMQTVEAGGQRFDVGATDIGGNYWMTRGLAPRVGLNIQDPTPEALAARFGGASAVGVGGTLINAREWAGSTLNPFSGRERAIPPPALLSAATGGEANPVTNINEWLAPALAPHDIPLSEWLAARDWSAKAIDYMDVGATYNGLDQVSALDVLRRNAMLRRGPQTVGSLAEGMQALPEAVASRLKQPVVFGAQVSEIAQQDDSVVVVTADGRRWRAPRVVVALPPGPLGKISFSPEPPPEQRKAWSERELTAVTAIHLKPLKPFWEADGLPLNMWLDGSIERVFGVPDANNRIERVLVWVNGRGAQAIDRMDDGEIGRWAQRELAQWRPAAEGATEVLAVRSWGRDPYTMGAFAEIAPGRCADTAQWTAHPLGRVHFAGEHTSFDQPGIEAALASGLRAAVEIAGAEKVATQTAPTA